MRRTVVESVVLLGTPVSASEARCDGSEGVERAGWSRGFAEGHGCMGAWTPVSASGARWGASAGVGVATGNRVG